MKGFIVREFGGPENMLWEDLPDPVPGEGQVLVRVKASGINFAETRMRAGTYGGQEIPFVMGMEGAGIVEAVGPGVTTFAAGDRVFGRARGCHAEKVLFAEEHLMSLPDNLSFADGAAIPVGWLTAWHALKTVAKLQPGRRVLIEAVASSVGSAALQIAKWKDTWVAGTASRDEKLRAATEAGADLVINYKSEPVAERLLAATNHEGVDIGLMTIGQETAGALFDSMAMDGQVRDVRQHVGPTSLFRSQYRLAQSSAFVYEHLDEPKICLRDYEIISRAGPARLRRRHLSPDHR